MNDPEKNTEMTPGIPNSGKVGQRLKKLRAGKGWSRDKMAEKSGIGAGAIEAIERGRRFPGGDQVLIMGQALGVSPNYILTGSDEYVPGADLSPTDLTKLYVALQQLDPSRRNMIVQMVVDLARAEVPDDQLVIFNNLMEAATLLPESVADKVVSVLDDDDLQEVEDHLNLPT